MKSSKMKGKKMKNSETKEKKMRKILLNDVQLRESGQVVGGAMSITEQHQYVEMLITNGIDIIEIGNPGSSPSELEKCQAIRQHVEQLACSQKPCTSISPTVIGYSYGTTNLWLQGSVAEAAIYSTVLSDERILKHFLAGWSTSQFGQAQAHIFGVEVSKIGLAQAQIIIEEKSYRYTVLQDDPILYFPMDETSYWGTKNLVRYPTSGTATYSASSYYSGSYLPDYAADGNYSDGWASSGYSAGNTWSKVTWSTPQTIDTVIITNRPNYTMGSGRIIFSWISSRRSPGTTGP